MDRNDAALAYEILHRYDDPATAEFDAVLAAAELADDVKRALRFWQRESVTSVKQFAAEALPAVFTAIDAANSGAAEAARTATAALRPRAGVRTLRLPDVPAPVDATPSPSELRRRTVAVRLAQLG